MEAIIKKMLGEQLFAVAMLQAKGEAQAKEIEVLRAQLEVKTAKKKAA